MHDHAGKTEGDPQLSYWSAGDAGPRVLFVMGFGMRGDLWRPQILDLSQDHQVAWYDHRGIGESEQGSKRFWSIKDMAADASAVLDALGWESAHLVGVSMGGMIAQEMAIADEGRFKSLSLLVTHSGGPLRRKVPPLPGLRAFAAANLRTGRARLESLRKVLYPDHYVAAIDTSTLRTRIALQLGRPVSRATTLAQLYAVVRHDTRDRLGSLSLPTLIMKAGQDILVQPESSDRLLELLPHARMIEFPDSGHGLIFQKAEEVNLALKGHISSTE